MYYKFSNIYWYFSSVFSLVNRIAFRMANGVLVVLSVLGLSKIFFLSSTTLRYLYHLLSNFCLIVYVNLHFRFRKGKMYEYEPAKFDSKSLMSFVDQWYKNVQAKPVPVEPSSL